MFSSSGNKHRGTLERLFRRQRIAQLSELRSALGVRSRTTVFFALKAIGYFSSYSHAGRYYTLVDIPRFDADGLWSHGGVRFSRHGTLRATAVVLVQRAAQGYTHEELQVVLGVRVHDTLRDLVEGGRLSRERVDAVYVYTDAAPEPAAAQIEQRRRGSVSRAAIGSAASERTQPPLELPVVVDVLLAVIAAPKDSAKVIAARLRHGGLRVSDEQVEGVFMHYGLGKKTARSPSKRSRR
jgi:hypothetical protein